jgi:putative transposase
MQSSGTKISPWGGLAEGVIRRSVNTNASSAILRLMLSYRRAFVPGGCWFFTVNLLERRQTLLVDHIATLREAVAATRASHDFAIDAIVVLPDHLHAIWKLPPGDCDFSTRWRLIKSRFAKALPKQERRNAVRLARNERGIWQRRFWEHLRRGRLCGHVEYFISTHPSMASSPA